MSEGRARSLAVEPGVSAGSARSLAVEPEIVGGPRQIAGCRACKGASRRGAGEGGHSGRGLCLYTPSTRDRLSLPRHL